MLEGQARKENSASKDVQMAENGGHAVVAVHEICPSSNEDDETLARVCSESSICELGERPLGYRKVDHWICMTGP